MAKDTSETKSKDSDIVQKQKNEIETLKQEVAKNKDPNAKPRTITKGDQVHPVYQKNNIKIAATLPKK